MHTEPRPQTSGDRVASAHQRNSVSIVCVFNDAEVLDLCLRRSLQDGIGVAPDTELIAMDNRANQFASAGAALNRGARSARNEVVAFVHQDVYLHSLPSLEQAAASLLADPAIGVVGSIGIDSKGQLIGRIRDRVVPIGHPTSSPLDVDSLDEVLFMVRREDILASPLTEREDLAWHAYAVEYSARVRARGQRATAIDIPITHNSMTTNLAHLDRAHARVGEMYPQLRPMHTTCGVVTGRGVTSGLRSVVRRIRRLAVWGGESLSAVLLRTRSRGGAIVLADMRFLVDRAAELAGLGSVRVLDLEDPGAEPTAVSGLRRGAADFAVATATPAEMRAAVSARQPTEALLLTRLRRADLSGLGLSHDIPHVVGYTHAGGLWAFVGALPDQLATLWPRRRNRAFGIVSWATHRGTPAAPTAVGSA